jgi:hypothetical protein
MNRTYTEREYVAGSGEPVYEVTFKCSMRAERQAVVTAGVNVPPACAFSPMPKPGEPFDAFEGVLPPHTPEGGTDGGEYRASLQFESAAGDLDPAACVAGVCTAD